MNRLVVKKPIRAYTKGIAEMTNLVFPAHLSYLAISTHRTSLQLEIANQIADEWLAAEGFEHTEICESR